MAGPGKISPVVSDDQVLVTLKYITVEQQQAGLKQQEAEVKAGNKERAIGEILKEQTSKSKNPITEKELDDCSRVAARAGKIVLDNAPEAGDPNPKRVDVNQVIKDVAKSLKVPDGKAVEPTQEKGSGKRAEGGRGWDPERLLTESSKPHKDVPPVEHVQRRG